MTELPKSADSRPRAEAIPRTELPTHCKAGRGVIVHARALTVDPGVEIGDNVRLVGDSVHLGAGVRIARGTDIRAGAVSIGPGSEMAEHVRVLCADRFFIGPAGRVSARADVVARSFDAGRLLYLGPHSAVGYGGTLESTATVRLGDRVTIGPHNILNANCPIEIGSDVGSGCYVSIWTHGYHFGHSVLNGYATAFQSVRVGDRVWLGYHCSLMPGVEIGDECIVAAGAVVTKSFPARRLLAGVPAQVKKEFTQAPLGAARALETVCEVLADWCRELAWKGATVVPATERAARRWTVDWAGRRRVVELWERTADGLSAGTAVDHDRIVIALDGEPVPDTLGHPLFVLRRGQLQGPSDELVEDLRDYLRRRTLPCGDDRTFSSITPLAFRRLTEATGTPEAEEVDV
jgi:acetyltransferase-like isoleucine patch superfamily enzyme